MLIPISLNLIVLILFFIIKKKGKISIPLLIQNKYSIRLIEILTGIYKHEEVLNYFIKRNTA